MIAGSLRRVSPSSASAYPAAISRARVLYAAGQTLAQAEALI